MSSHADCWARSLHAPHPPSRLVTLALQNACLAIVMHRSRVGVSPSHSYSPATAVLLNELLKGSISLVIAFKRIDTDMTNNPPRQLTGSSSSSTSSSSASVALMPNGYLAEKVFEDDDDAPVSPIYASKSRGGGGFMPSLSSTMGSSGSRGGAGVKQSVAGLPTNLSSLKRSPLVALYRKDWRSRFSRLGGELFSKDCWKLSIPAILYGQCDLLLANMPLCPAINHQTGKYARS